jgi:hypothetical protein
VARNHHSAGVKGNETGRSSSEGRLACAVVTYQADDLTGGHRQFELVERNLPSELFTSAVHFNQRRHIGSSTIAIQKRPPGPCRGDLLARRETVTLPNFLNSIQ